MLQTFPHSRDFPIAWTLAAAVLSAGASCAPRFDPANARAQFSSKAQSMEGSEPTTADPHPSTNSPAPIAVATTGATNVAVPQIAAPAQSFRFLLRCPSNLCFMNPLTLRPRMKPVEFCVKHR